MRRKKEAGQLPDQVEPITLDEYLEKAEKALNKAVEWGYLRENPTKNIKKPREQLTPPRPFETREQVDAVAAAFTNPRHSALVIVACETGLRSQELRALRERDVDRQERRLRIEQTIRNDKIEAAAKTTSSLRTVRLTARALAALDSLPRQIDRNALIFPGRNGQPYDPAAFRRGPWRKALEAAGVEQRDFHSTRDTFATLALADRAPIEWVSKQLGHASITTTLKHYHRWLPSADDAILSQLDAAGSGLKKDSVADDDRLHGGEYAGTLRGTGRGAAWLAR